ncbi:nucleotide exchange factor GrpE [Natribacillus halophilus]|uniref:Molecular chaperone GrpE (Heat shock protein) n=1 Tax=Natribacillus halophilus TaxID=549003 RepID=A0A1G8S6V1_9BACI|nr:nucleotide exchange factor GrpE [Natribacillus halophilus]SDJ24954.1 Molecular chaperone GrpE (heat shock protein) [Natribacillus halophilus]
MKWKFWEKENKLDADVSELKQQTDQLQEHLTGIGEQLQKQTRLQYKTSKNTEEKLNALTEMMEKQEQASASAHNMGIIQQLIRQIDDMDMVNAQLIDDPSWEALLKKWSEALLQMISELGVKECIQNGEMFDPKRAEAIETISPSEHAAIPYEIVKIHQRGFSDANGDIIRKAQVTTIKENLQ